MVCDMYHFGSLSALSWSRPRSIAARTTSARSVTKPGLSAVMAAAISSAKTTALLGILTTTVALNVSPAGAFFDMRALYHAVTRPKKVTLRYVMCYYLARDRTQTANGRAD